MRFPAVTVLAAISAIICVSLLAGCGGGTSTAPPVVSSISLTPATISLNEGAVASLSAVALNSAGNVIAADITFSSSNSKIATVSSSGLVCGGVWDSSIINCNATNGQAGVGQVTITATSGGATATATVYVHLQVDRVVVTPLSGCTTMGQQLSASASAYNTSAAGCSQASPCDITSTVGPITISSNNPAVVASSQGIEASYSAVSNSPTYSSGGSVTGATGQTCNLSNFSLGGSTGIDPVYSGITNSPTYTSGGTITGSAGQTCNLSSFNGVTGATAIVALTAANTIASGTHLTITASGSGATTPPTTATLSNGTATCSGTANVITALVNNAGGGFGVIGAAATVALTSKNAIAAGTHLTVTASGYGATTPPTTATLSNGSATCSGTASVITALNNIPGLTAEGPGSTSVFGSVSGVNSVGVSAITCPVTSIYVHDASGPNTSFTLTAGGTQPLTADVYDSNGQYIKPKLTWASSINASATVANTGAVNNPATVTAVAPGTVSVTATCSSPNCNIDLPAQYSENVATVQVTGTTSTVVFAASTNSTSLIPITTSNNTAGTAVTLPNLPNSIISDPGGTTLYLGSSSGLMAVNLSTAAVTGYSVNGTIMGISPSGQFMLISDSVANNVYLIDLSNQTILSTNSGMTATSAAFTPDSGFDNWVNGTQLGFGLPYSTQTFLTLAYTANAVDFIAQGGLTYITSSSGREVDVRATCNQSEVQTLTANAPTLVSRLPNGTGAVAADSPAIDVISTPSTVTGGCPVTTNTSTLATYDLGAGTFKASQLFLSADSSRAWIISDLPALLTFNLSTLTPTSIPFTGGATPLSGGVRLDGQQLYIGASDGLVHRIDVASLTDAAQITVGLKDSKGNAVTPNLVYVLP
jgi:hypothetical protein